MYFVRVTTAGGERLKPCYIAGACMRPSACHFHLGISYGPCSRATLASVTTAAAGGGGR